MDIGQIIKLGRIKKGLKQKDIADAMGVSVSLISSWENNTRNPNADEIIKLANMLDVVSELFPGYAKKNSNNDIPLEKHGEIPTEEYRELSELIANEQRKREILLKKLHSASESERPALLQEIDKVEENIFVHRHVLQMEKNVAIVFDTLAKNGMNPKGIVLTDQFTRPPKQTPDKK